LDKDHLRELAVKMHGFLVIEGLSSMTIERDWGTYAFKTYNGGTDPKEATAHIEIKNGRCLVTIAPKGVVLNKPGAQKVMVYNGPVKWLKGVVDYEVPADERD
jgi:hypothetical protein